MSWDYRLAAAVALVLTWGVGDTVTTLWAVDLAGTGAEANPISRELLERDLFVIAKTLVSSVVAYLGVSDIDPSDRVWVVVFTILSIGSGAVAASNLIQILLFVS